MARFSALVLRHVAFEDLGLFAAPLADAGYAITYCDPSTDPEALDASDPDLVVVLGAPLGVYEGARYPWVYRELDFLGRRLAANRPTLGICFGAQLIAAALGARVFAGPTKEIGWHALAVSTDLPDNPLAGLGSSPVLHWHGDTFYLPDHCEHLAATSTYHNQAFRRGREILALQFHLEVESGGFERWLIGHAVELAQAKIDVVALREQTLACAPRLAPVAVSVVEAWLEGIRR